MSNYEYITSFTSPNQTHGRPYGIHSITIHHWDAAAKHPRFQPVVDWLCRPRGSSSAHYVVEAGKVACIVDPDNRAWHAGDGLRGHSGNNTSIGIECNPRRSESDLETVAQLIADLRTTYGNLPLFPHKHWHSTDCPGEWESKLSWLDQRANQLMDAKAPANNNNNKPPARPAASSVDELAREVIAGKWGNGQSRRNRLGSQYAAVQARVNQILKGSSHHEKSVDELAREVIAGKWGNGQSRRNRLGSQYAAVQARVNQILRGK